MTPSVEELLPVGPFCPYASPRLKNLCADERHRTQMEDIVMRIDRLAEVEDATLADHLALGREIRDADAVWRGNLMQMRHSEDFQTQELYHFTDAHLQTLGVSVAEVEKFAAWQAEALEAMGQRRPLPAPQALPGSEKATHLRGLLDSFRLGRTQTLSMDLSPPEALEESVADEELAALQRDHAALIAMGQDYGSFDAAGKKIFIDQIDQIEERWRVYLGRLRLMGEADPPFVQSIRPLLERLGLRAAEANAVLREAHRQLRSNADARSG
ncbi:NLRC3 [Symbiodinium natans]|uniref:NLRC3 protein n=1 Tax=Symbiodinium natans TaxID=878477 RepID=A0A812IP03_9DINO|nr:NLRC3 [Symbiodinium natans]